MKHILKIIGLLFIAYLFLAFLFPRIFAIPFAAWNSHQVWKKPKKEQFDDLKPEDYVAMGVYEYQTENKEENHFIFIDTIDTELIGFYYGTEDGKGHGIFHYGTPLLNFKLTENKIEFEIGPRELYETTRFKINKPSQETKKENPVGLSKSVLKYTGVLTEFGFKIKCESEFQDCWENEMEFKKING